jgi:hypothetical protein
MNIAATIHRERLDGAQRINYTAKLFGNHFPMQLEPFIFDMARRLSEDYRGGLWHFYALTNEAFYMAPDLPETFLVQSQNGYQGTMSADALGITACLYAYSHLSFTGRGEFAETCARHYHRLLEYTFEHLEATQILACID